MKETSARRKKMKKENSDINRRERMLRRQASFVQPPPDAQTAGSTCDRYGGWLKMCCKIVRFVCFAILGVIWIKINAISKFNNR